MISQRKTATRQKPNRVRFDGDSVRYGRSRRRQEPFIVTVCKVGTTLAMLCVFVFCFHLFHRSLFPRRSHIPRPPKSGIKRKHDRPQHIRATEDHKQKVAASAPEEEDVVFFPHFTLDKSAESDVYAIAGSLLGHGSATSHDVEQFLNVAKELRNAFSDRYGGLDAARGVLFKGMTSPEHSASDTDQQSFISSSLLHTAQRIKDARQSRRSFQMAFGGSSSTLGAGNYFNQSFPFVVDRILKKPMQSLGIDLVVRNVAVNGIPSFPYGWCMRNFYGQDLDVISWDFGPHERYEAEGLEAFLRHVPTLNGQGRRITRPPMIIVKDSYRAMSKRQNLLQSYVDAGVTLDPLIVHTDSAAGPFLKLKENDKPKGFRNWKEFGGPSGAPGKLRVHMTLQEHELMGWLIAMRFLAAMQLVVAGELGNLDSPEHIDEPKVHLPAPVSTKGDVPSIIWGSPTTGGEWNMPSFQCATTFDPIVQGDLSDLVVSGTTAEDIDLLLPKGPMFYNSGWLLDLAENEKKHRTKIRKWNSFGYPDTKKAYYGVVASGKIRLFLPYEPKGANDGNAELRRQLVETNAEQSLGSASTETRARSRYRSLIVCEENDIMGEDACNLQKDVSFFVGGVETEGVRMLSERFVTFLGKSICAHIDVPADASLTTREAMEAQSDEKGRFLSPSSMGLSLEIAVSNRRVLWKTGPCSISHVIWELQ